MCVDFDVRDNRRWTFSLVHSFSLLRMLIAGLEWSGLFVDYCGVFISCLDSHSDGTHSTAEDPLMSKWWNATFLQIWSNEETNSSTSLILNFNFWMNYAFILNYIQNSLWKIYNPKSEKVGTVWKTQIKKESSDF